MSQKGDTVVCEGDVQMTKGAQKELLFAVEKTWDLCYNNLNK